MRTPANVLTVALAAIVGCKAAPASERAATSVQSVVAALTDTAADTLVLISGPARTALDSANALFKARRYAHALGVYRAAARLAPDEPAPLLGMLMVATALDDNALGDSVRAALQAQSARNTAVRRRN